MRVVIVLYNERTERTSIEPREHFLSSFAKKKKRNPNQMLESKKLPTGKTSSNLPKQLLMAALTRMKKLRPFPRKRLTISTREGTLSRSTSTSLNLTGLLKWRHQPSPTTLLPSHQRR